MEFESFQEGTLLYIGVKEGESAEVDSILAIIGSKGENIENIIKNNNTEKEANNSNSETHTKEPEYKKPEIKEPEIKEQFKNENLLFSISPIAKKIASENNIQLQLVKGTGDNGRIIKRDIEKLLLQNKSSSKDKNYSKKLSQMRTIIAEKLSGK